MQDLIMKANKDRYMEQYQKLEPEKLFIGEYAYLKFEYGSNCH